MSKTSSAILCLLVLLAAAPAIRANGHEAGSPDPSASPPCVVEEPCSVESFSSLPQEKQAKIYEIVEDSMPTLRDLDMRIGQKMQELGSMTFDSVESQDALPRLGMELQRLREELRNALKMVNMRLQKEVGVSMTVPASGGVSAMRGYCQPSRYSAGERIVEQRRRGHGSGHAERHNIGMSMPATNFPFGRDATSPGDTAQSADGRSARDASQ